MKSSMFFFVLLFTFKMTKSMPANATSEEEEEESSSVDPEQIVTGMEAGQAIAEFVSAGDFGGALTASAESLNLFLAVIGPLASFALSFIPTGDSAEMQVMKEQFPLVNTKLDILTSEFTEVKNAIDWNAVTVTYATYEQKITAAEANLVRIYKYEGKVRENEMEYFIKQYDNHFDNSVQTLYDAMMNEDHLFASNILSAVVKQTKNHKRKFEQFSLGLLRLLVQGIKVKISYYGFKNYSTQHVAEEWDGKVASLKIRLQEISNETKAAYHTQLREDVEDMLRRSTDLSNKALALKLHRFITEKYDWRYFFAAVYDDFQGDGDHFASVCGGHAFFNLYGRNTVIASQDKSLKSKNSQSEAKVKLLNKVHNDATRCRSGMKATSSGFKYAKALVQNVLAKQQGKCSPNQLILAVRFHNNLHAHNPNGHRATREFPDVITCSCTQATVFGGAICQYTYWNHMLILFG